MRSSLPVLLALLFLGASLAGCTDDPEQDETASTGSPSPTPSVPTSKGGSRELVAGSAPLWFPGLEWTYQVEHPSRGITGDVTLVLVADDGEVWQVAPKEGSSEEAVTWSLFTHMPPLGPVEKETLSPFIHDTAIAWFDFPLHDGKTWQGDEHHGTQVNFTATAVDVTLFDGRKARAFEVVGERNGVTWVQYTYTAEVAWFTQAAMDGNGDGVFDTRITLKDAGVGTAHRDTPTFEPFDLAIVDDQGPATITEPATAFSVPEDVEDLYVFFVLGGGPGRYTGSVTLPSGSVKSFNYTNTNQTFQVHVQGAHYKVHAGEGNVGTMILGEGFVFGELFGITRNPP